MDTPTPTPAFAPVVRPVCGTGVTDGDGEAVVGGLDVVGIEDVGVVEEVLEVEMELVVDVCEGDCVDVVDEDEDEDEGEGAVEVETESSVLL